MSELSPLLEGAADYVREISQMLDKIGIKATTGPLPSAWGTRAWLAVASKDSKDAQAAYEAYLDKMVGDDKALQHSRTVADFDAEKTTCPACLSEFATAGVQYCPECGLKFG